MRRTFLQQPSDITRCHQMSPREQRGRPTAAYGAVTVVCMRLLHLRRLRTITLNRRVASRRRITATRVPIRINQRYLRQYLTLTSVNLVNEQRCGAHIETTDRNRKQETRGFDLNRDKAIDECGGLKVAGLDNNNNKVPSILIRTDNSRQSHSAVPRPRQRCQFQGYVYIYRPTS